MKKTEGLPSNLLALIGNEPFMNKIYELSDSGFDSKTTNRMCREIVRYYFKLKEPESTLKIDAVVRAINVVALEPTRDSDLISQADYDLGRMFEVNNVGDFKELMKNVAMNVDTSKPYLIPKQPSLPPLPTPGLSLAEKENAKNPSAPSTEDSKRPAQPQKVPYLAQYSKKQSDNLQVIRDINVEGNKFTIEAALKFVKSQKRSKSEAEKGYQAATKALGIDVIYQHIDKLAQTALKNGDQEALKNVVGLINEATDLIRAKKSELNSEEKRANYNMNNLQISGTMVAVLTLAEMKLEQISYNCTMNIKGSDRISRG